MGDAFKGLTIRIGADVRPLNSALNSIKSAAGQAQAPLNRLSRALKDGAIDAQAMSARVGLLEDKISLSARATHQVTAAWNQASDRMKQAVAQGKGMYSNTQRIRMEMRDTNQQIQRMHDALAKVRADAKATKLNEDLSAQIKKLEADMAALPNKSGKAYVELNRKLTEAKKKLEALGTVAGQKNIFAQALKEVKQLSHALNGAGEDAQKAQTELMELAKKIDAANKPLDIFDGDDETRANQILSYLREMKQLHNQLDAEQTFANQAQELSEAKVQMAAYRAEMRQAILDQTRFEAELIRTAMTPGLERAAMDVKAMDAAVDAATQSVQKMNAAANELPTSMKVATANARALATEQETVRQKLAAVEQKMHELRNAAGFDAVAAASRNVYVAAERTAAKYSEVKEKVRLTRAAIEQLEEEIRQAHAASEAGTNGAKADLDRLEAEVKKLTGDLEVLETRERIAKKAFTGAPIAKELREADEEAVQLAAHLDRIQNTSLLRGAFAGMASDMRTLGYGLYSTVTPAILMAGRYAIQSAEDVDSAYRDMRKTVNGTEEQFEHLRSAALEFGRTHVTSADQILEIESIGGQLGIAADDLEAFATTVSNLDIATNMDTEDIALDLAKLSNIMHFSSEQYDSFADALVRLGNNEPALESDIMKISTRFAGMAANVGMSTEDMLAFATAATATGQKAEAAGSSFQRTLGRIETAVAGGGQALEQYAEISGMSAEEFKATWEDTGNHGPAKAIQAFIEGLHEVHESGGSVTATLRELGITGVRDTQQLEGLSNITDILSESLGMASDAWRGMWTEMEDGTIEYAGDAAREAGRKAEGFSGQLQLLRNSAQELGVTMLDSAVPMLQQFTSMFQNLTGSVSAAPDWMKDIGVKAAIGVAALGPLLIAFGAIGDAVSKGSAALSKFFGSVTQARAAAQLARENYARLGAEISKNEFQLRNLVAFQERHVAATGKENAAINESIAATRAKTAALRQEQATYKGSQSVLSSFKGALKGIGGFAAITVLFEAVSLVADAISTATENANNFKAATQGLADANLVPSVDAVSDSIGRIADQATSSAMSISELTAAGAEMVQTMTDRTTKAQNQIARLNEAKEIIAEYGSQSSHTAAEMGEFSMAVSTVNELCHAQIGIADLATGALTKQGNAVKDVASEIGGLVDAQIQQLQTSTLEANLSELNTQVDNAFDTVAKLQTMQMDTSNLFTGSAMPDAMAVQAAQNAKDLADAQEVLESYTAKQQSLVEAYGAMKAIAGGYDVDAGTIAKANLKLRSSLDAYGEGTFDTFIKSLGGLNVNAKSLQETLANNDSILTLARQFATGGADAATLKASLEALGVTFNTGKEQATAYGTALEQATAGMTEDEANEFTEKVQKDMDTLGNLVNQFPSLEGMLTPATSDMQTFALAVQQAGFNLDELSAKMTELADAASNGFQKIATDSEMNLETYRQNLEANRTLMEGWSNNLRTIYDKVGENDVARAWVQSVAEAGPQYAGMIEEMAGKSAEELNAMALEWQAAAEAGAEGGMAVYDYSKDRIIELAGQARDGVAGVADDAAATSEKVMASLKEVGDYVGHPKLVMDGFEAGMSLVSKAKDMLSSLSGASSTTVTTNVTADASQAEAAMSGVEGKKVDDKEFVIKARDLATGVINALNAKSLENKPQYIDVIPRYSSQGKPGNASGGILPRYAKGAVFPKVLQSVPKFASGAINGIVTRPTMTNVGLTGEAGAEAILHMKHAGGAIIPLSNRRYVRPFARAVASEMGAAGGNTVNVNVNLNYAEGSDAAEMALGIANQLNAILDMEG